MLVWEGNADFKAALDQIVLKPYTEPDLFHPELNPIRHLALIYGRPGVGKKEAVTAFCKKHEIPHFVVEVTFGQASNVIEHMDHAIRKQSEAICPIVAKYGHGDHDTIYHVIIIDRFDILLFEPDTEGVMSFVLQLDQLAFRNRALFICLSDRLPSEESAEPVSHMTRLYRQRVIAQFRAKAMLGAPHDAYRQALFKSLLEAFVEHQRGGGGVDITLDLSDGDYSKLSDASAYSTPLDIANFLKGVFYKIASNDPPPFCRPADAPVDEQTGKRTGPMRIDMNVLDAEMSNAIGSRHILREDPRRLEELYNMEATGNPLASTIQSKARINATGFSKGLVDSKNAAEVLKARVPKRERDEEIDQYWKDEDAKAEKTEKNE